MKRILIALTALALAVVMPQTAAEAAKPSPAPMSAASVSWNGSGMTGGAGAWTLSTSDCSVDATPHLLFVLSATKSSTATIALSAGATPVSMGKPVLDKTGWATFKYDMQSATSIDLGALLAGGVAASYNDAKNKGVLTVSHGCTGTPAPAVCASVPVNSVLPVVTYDRPTDGVTGTDGTWTSIANCTNVYSYAWEEYTYSYPGYSWGPMAGTSLNETAAPCADLVRLTVTATNEFGTASATSLDEPTGLNC